MLIAAIGHLYAFPYKEYAGANIGGSNGFMRSLAHALKLNDFYHDTVHQVYSDLCVLYACDLLVMVPQVLFLWMILSPFCDTIHFERALVGQGALLDWVFWRGICQGKSGCLIVEAMLRSFVLFSSRCFQQLL